MIPRWPISPEVAKAIMKEQEERRRLREQNPDDYPAWRCPFGVKVHLIACLILLVLGSLLWLVIA